MNSSKPVYAPFQLTFDNFEPWRRGLLNVARPMLERLLALGSLNAVYGAIKARPADREFNERALECLDVTVAVDPGDLRRVPAAGPVIVVANHPFGGVDGLALAALMHRVRPDAKLIVNSLLSCIPEFRESTVPVDAFGGPDAVRRNRAGVKEAMRWLEAGHALGVFPAGGVSHRTWRDRHVSDPPWSELAARLAQRVNCPVVPVFFAGENSRLFQSLGLIHPRLRTAMLPRELLRRRASTLSMFVGRAIAPARLARFATSSDATDFLRLRTYVLRGRAGTTEPPRRPAPPSPQGRPIVAAAGLAELRQELAGLPADARLLENGGIAVYEARAAAIPHLLREIGRQREIAFRAAGEGTGRAIDLDRFDPHYWHLFAWDTEKSRLVGAYRLGATDEIVPRQGPAGLYTSTLFRYSPQLMSRLDPALELGRSFVTASYQKSYSALLLLWKGIGSFVVRRPRYRNLFGPVSISDEYQSMTKVFVTQFLRAHDRRSGWDGLVQPRNPPRLPRFRDCGENPLSTVAVDLDEMDELVREIEADRRALPVLLRQYLRLNAKLLGFNVDPDFGDVLDALLVCDLTTVDRGILSRYLGARGHAEFLRHHGVAP